MAAKADNADTEQKLKSAIWYKVGRMAEEIEEEEEITVSKQFIAVLAETTFRHASNMAQDLEDFAKHAKRSTVQPDDIKLYVRKTPPIYNHLDDIDKSVQENKKKPKTKTKSKSSTDTG